MGCIYAGFAHKQESRDAFLRLRLMREKASGVLSEAFHFQRIFYNFYMLEITAEAVVLDKEDIGECDSRIFFYTGEFGKIIAKATSVRKIASKLAAHLEPLNYVTARFVSKQNGDAADIRGFQIADALLMDNAGRLKTDSEKLRNTLRAFHLISRIIPEGVADDELWVILSRSIREGIPVTIQDALGFLGFGKDFADCALCRKTNPEYIYSRDNMFVCRYCALKSLISLEEFVKL